MIIEHKELITNVANTYELDPYLVMAIVQAESRGDHWSNRVEVKNFGNNFFKLLWKYLLRPEKFAKKLIASKNTEIINQGTSWGLMHVMGTVAREYGFHGWLTQLCDLYTGLKYGCIHLKNKINKYGLKGGISAYNAGSPSEKNQEYVDKVLRLMEDFKNENS